MLSHYKTVFTTKSKAKKEKFKKLYGRKPTKEEVKLLRKNLIDVGSVHNPNNYKSISDVIDTNQTHRVDWFWRHG